MSTTPVICLYHDPCRSCDGWAAAMGVYQAYGPTAILKGVSYNVPLPALDYTNAKVYVVDFFPSNVADLYPILEVCKSLVIIDHHKGVADAIATLVHYAASTPHSNKLKIIYDTEKSVALLTWEHFQNEKIPLFPVWIPSIIRAIDDYDRWVFKRPNTRIIIASISVEPKTTDRWEYLLYHKCEHEIVAIGDGILAYQDTLVDALLTNVRIVEFEGHTVPVVNCPYDLVDATLERLTADYPFAVAYSDMTTQRKYSLRARKGCTDIILKIAQSHGGGGHAAACGFYTPLTTVLF